MTVTVDFTALCIDFTFLVYFMGKNIICPAGDSNPRPFGLVFSIKLQTASQRSRLFELLKNEPLNVRAAEKVQNDDLSST
jgi:hypothetical protein